MIKDNLRMMKSRFFIDEEKVMPFILKTKPASSGINDYTCTIAVNMALSILMQQPDEDSSIARPTRKTARIHKPYFSFPQIGSPHPSMP